MRNKLLTTRYLQPGETEPDMYKRVASAVCRNRYSNEFAQEVTAAMQNFFFLPNSPTLANAGTSKVGGLSACYVLPIHDSLDSIYKTLRDAALVHKFFGGTGFDFSEVRPRGSPIESTGGSACGVLKVIELFNQGADTIRQGGKREGANMGVLRCDHPDIEEFIRAKEHDGVLTHFNLSVAATDDFMKKGDADLFDQIVHHAWLHGDPGIIFIDAINRNNVNKHLYDIAATNPCSELPLGPYESCNLGSLNLSKFCIEGDFDLDLFKEHIRIGVRFLDSVIDINNFPIPEIREATLATRKIGLGIMGWHDLLIQLEIPYASREAMEPIHVIGNVLRKTSIDESCILAEEYGVYPAWEGSEWQKRGIEIRNSTLLTIAPTGTISFLAGCSSGIEPHFAKDFTRTSEAGSTSYHLDINDAEISHNINWQWHLNHQANWQKYIDNSISKTINLPSSATEDDIREIYKTAHGLGCKGVTIYRDGSKTSQVLTTSSAPRSTPKPQSLLPPGVTRRPGHIYTLPSGCGTMRVIIGAEDERYESLREVFVLTAGGCTANNESTGRQISDSLEYGMPATLISSTLHKVKCINAMKNKESIGKSCSDNIGLCIDWELRDFVKGAQAPTVQVPTCPDCHKPLSFGSGCAQGECPHCGWSGCS